MTRFVVDCAVLLYLSGGRSRIGVGIINIAKIIQMYFHR
jgi:hypothetical protein